MGKERNSYRGFTVNAIKLRSDIPAQVDIAEHTGHIDCSNIRTSDIRTVIGETTNSVYSLCNSNLINKWSGFAPVVRNITGGVVVNTLKGSPAALGDFAGYDHTALTPAHTDNARTTAVRVYGAGATATKAITVQIGQPRYKDEDIANDGSIVGIALALYDGGTFLGAGVTDLDDCTDWADLTAETTALYSDTTITGKVYLVDSTVSFDQSGSNIRGKWSEIGDFNFNAIIMIANHIDVSPDSFLTSDDTSLEAADCSFSSYNGTLTFPNIHSHSSDPYLVIRARLVHQIGGLVEEQLIWDYNNDGPYTADTVITGNTITFTEAGEGTDTPPYTEQGYTFQIIVESGA